ncbi:cupin domain-containing protein [Marmoricola sp. RAF53]|uniref:cupin domain-containing protein n=1 Tax=Marmoricola sp. RAF53 TaxID=3233059 RepID=UPI003F95E20A
MTSAAVLRAADAVALTSERHTLRLLLDSSDTGGAVSTHRVLLRAGAEGAAPHRHLTTTELFYVLSGAVDLLAGADVLHAIEGDLVVVPPGVDHAFGATARADGELLVLVTPGIERFDFFRAVHEVATGRADRSVLAGSDERYDNHAASALALDGWRSSRPGDARGDQS